MSGYDYFDDLEQLEPMPIVDPECLIGSAFLLDEQEDVQKLSERIVEAINTYDDKDKNNPDLL